MRHTTAHTGFWWALSPRDVIWLPFIFNKFVTFSIFIQLSGSNFNFLSLTRLLWGHFHKSLIKVWLLSQLPDYVSQCKSIRINAVKFACRLRCRACVPMIGFPSFQDAWCLSYSPRGVSVTLVHAHLYLVQHGHVLQTLPPVEFKHASQQQETYRSA